MNFSSLIAAGYTASDILGALTKKGGESGKKITKALSLGYSAAEILNKLMGGKDGGESFMTLEEKTQNNFDKQKRKAAIQAGLAGAGAVGGISALLSRKPIQQAAAALAGPSQSPTTLQGQVINKPPGGSPSTTSAQDSIINRIPATAQTLTPQAAASPSPVQGMASPSVNKSSLDISKDFPQIEQFVKKHIESGKSPQETHRLLKSSKTLSVLAKRFEDKTGESFKTVVDSIYDKNKSSKKTSKKDLIDNVNVLKNLMNELREK